VGTRKPFPDIYGVRAVTGDGVRSRRGAVAGCGLACAQVGGKVRWLRGVKMMEKIKIGEGSRTDREAIVGEGKVRLPPLRKTANRYDFNFTLR
jgi:hypothetical protein